MKKELTYTALLTLTLMSSCSNLLDIEPQNSVTIKNGVKTEKDIRSLISNLEEKVRITAGQAMVNSGSALPRVFESYNFDWVAPAFIKDLDFNKLSNSPSAQWAQYYRQIQLANIPLGLIDQSELPVERKSYYKGQAYFYKAFAYLWLIQVFGDVILIKDDVILDHVPKTAWPEVADYAIDLAEKAIAALPEYSQIKYDELGSKPINKFTPSKGAANALLAELCAWKAGAQYLVKKEQANYDAQALWIKAEKACSDIINSNEYTLAANPEEVCESVLVGNSKESIFEVEVRTFWDEIKSYHTFFSGVASSHIGPNLDPLWSQNYFVNQLSHILVDSVNNLFTPQDLRRKSYFYKIDSLASIPSYQNFVVPNKYRKAKLSTSGTTVGTFEGIDQNWITWRLTQIYLLRAECRARLNNVAGATADLNKVRRRANALEYNSSEGDLRFAIFEEKSKKEMLFEPYTYWFDIVRNGYAAKELAKFNYDKITQQDMYDGALFTAITYSASGMEMNPRIVQNIYWSKRFGW